MKLFISHNHQGSQQVASIVNSHFSQNLLLLAHNEMDNYVDPAAHCIWVSMNYYACCIYQFNLELGTRELLLGVHLK